MFASCNMRQPREHSPMINLNSYYIHGIYFTGCYKKSVISYSNIFLKLIISNVLMMKGYSLFIHQYDSSIIGLVTFIRFTVPTKIICAFRFMVSFWKHRILLSVRSYKCLQTILLMTSKPQIDLKNFPKQALFKIL